MSGPSGYPRFLPCGDTGLTVELGADVNAETSAHVLGLSGAIEAAGLRGVIETVPAYRSLLIHYDPLQTSQAELRAGLDPLLAGHVQTVAREPQNWILPVCFEGKDFAPDLDHVAEWAGLRAEEVVRHIVDARQHVYMLGFAPGQPYLGDLPDSLAIPRRADPVPMIPAGSVVIATGKTVIYPADNPTGWYIVGRTPVPLFDALAKDPVLLRPGDHVQFRAVDQGQYAALAERLASGRFDARQELQA